MWRGNGDKMGFEAPMMFAGMNHWSLKRQAGMVADVPIERRADVEPWNM